MIVVRLYKLDNDKKLYVSKTYTRNIHRTNNVQVNLTPQKKRAMIFKTIEELTQFQYMITTGNHGVNANQLKMEREELDMSFEEVYGEDLFKEGRVEKMNFLATRDFLNAHIADLNKALKSLNDINMNELPEEKQKEVADTKDLLAKERDIYLVELQALLADEK